MLYIAANELSESLHDKCFLWSNKLFECLPNLWNEIASQLSARAAPTGSSSNRAQKKNLLKNLRADAILFF